MIEEVEDAEPEALRRFDQMIDVRSPGEFAEDHLPGAVNLPVLSDAERAEVGEIYTRRSKFEARRLGAARIARNVAGHLEGPLRAADGAFRPLLYCWRGGQRSRSMAVILSEIGYRVGVLRGGYRTYRRRVVRRLYEERSPWPFLALSGGTGVGKTRMLSRLGALGAQVLDLERLAAHRGSLFGLRPGAVQPSQKRFESDLLAALEGFDPDRPVFVEAESSRIGELFVPPGVFEALASAPRARLSAPLEARAAYVASAYADVAEDLEALERAIRALPRHHASADKAELVALARGGRLEEVALRLIRSHYDPAYQRSEASRPGPPLLDIALSDLSEAEQERAARRLLEAAAARPAGLKRPAFDA